MMKTSKSFKPKTKITTKCLAREFIEMYYAGQKYLQPSILDSLSGIIEKVILISNKHEGTTELDDAEFIDFIKASSMSVDFLKSELKRNYLHIVEMFFTSSGYIKKKSIARAYKLKESVLQQLLEFISSTKDTSAEWVSDNNRVINKIEYGILTTDENHKRIKSTICIDGLVPVNVDLLDVYINRILKIMTPQPVPRDERIDLEKNGFGVGIYDRGGREVRLQSLWKLYTLRRLSLKHKAFPQIYIETDNGRIVGIGYNLQNTIGKRIRRIALSNQNMYDYDMEASTPTIYVSLAKKYNVAVPAMEKYLQNKKKIREDLSEKYDTSVKDIKGALNALFYGVGTRTSGFSKYKTGLIEVFKSKSLTEEFLKDDFIKDIIAERKILFEEILSNADMPRGKTLVNVLGKSVSLYETVNGKRQKCRENSLISHIVFGYEALIIQTTFEVLKSLGIKVYLLVSDGFVADETSDITKIESAVRDKLKDDLPNLNLKYSMEKL
ncbi:MAG: hypothetical protein ABSC53_05245 [Bacteroidota bacterium]